jgi:hypothetical protein
MLVRIYRTALTVCLVFSLICLLEPPARAYIDPGSGLLAYQTLSALVTGVLFYFRQRIRNVIRSVRDHRNIQPPSL